MAFTMTTKMIPPDTTAALAFQLKLTPENQSTATPAASDAPALSIPFAAQQQSTPPPPEASTPMAGTAPALTGSSNNGQPSSPPASPLPQPTPVAKQPAAAQLEPAKAPALVKALTTLKPDTTQAALPNDPPEKVIAVAGSQGTGDRAQGSPFQNSFHQPPPAPNPQTSAPDTPQTPDSSPVQTLLQPAEVRTGPAQQITVRISTPDQPNVDLHVAQRAGQVQVAVRTGDPGLQVALRDDLGSLVHSLERSGFRAETVTPVAGTPQAESSQMNSSGDHSDAQQNFSGNGGSGAGGGQSGRGNQQDGSRRPQTYEDWANTLEEQTV
jgi:hypothetical protein